MSRSHDHHRAWPGQDNGGRDSLDTLRRNYFDRLETNADNPEAVQHLLDFSTAMERAGDDWELVDDFTFLKFLVWVRVSDAQLQLQLMPWCPLPAGGDHGK